MADLNQDQVAAIMVPLPAQGHLNQLLHLARLIASYHIPVHYVGAATHNHQARLRAHSWDPPATNNIIHFHDFPRPPFHTPPPEPGCIFPTHLLPAMKSTVNLREPFFRFLQQVSRESRRVIVAYDSLMACAVQDVHLVPNAEPYCFQNCSAFAVLSFHLEKSGKQIPPEAGVALRDLPEIQRYVTPDFLGFLKIQSEARKFNFGNIFNTCRAVEDQFLDLLADVQLSGTNKTWAIGPFNPVKVSQEESNHRHECLEWLDNQAPRSVLFVSFGTTTSFSNEQIEELALGLEQSGQSFIWVLRVADRGDIFTGDHDSIAQLPEGYEVRIKPRGVIVKDWAPQLEILAHSSTGGFMSHCGWNSCMESITMGVPIAAWPVHTDQPRNSVLVTKVLNTGLLVRDLADNSEVVRSTTIEDAVRRLMASPEGDQLRQKAAELSNAVKHSVIEDGATSKEMKSFIAHITR